MPKATVEQHFQIAIREHQAGHLAEAERLYRQILAEQPNHAGALQLLGVIAHQSGHVDIAIDLISRAVALQPNSAEAHGNLGNVLKDKGELDQAIAEYQRAMLLQPGYAETHNNLANVLAAKGEFDAALASYEKALQLKPDYAEALNNRGNIFRQKGEFSVAVESYRQAIRINPNYQDAHVNLGQALTDRGDVQEAAASFQRAIQLKPNSANAYNGLGLLFRKTGQLDRALAAFQQTIQLNPNFTEAHHNLGIILKDKGQIDEAIESFRETIRIKPSYAEGYHALGGAWKDKGQLDQSIACYRQALELSPNDPVIHSNLVYALHFDPVCTPAELFAEQRRWARQHSEPLRQSIHPHQNSRDPDRRIRLGYISPDFRVHPVGRFLLPLLANHDHQRFEIFCYSSVAAPDEVTRRIQSHADVLRDINPLSDAQVGEQIRTDQIDILIDLSMHMGDNRLLVFARKPAPLQVTYLAYAGTTGLETIDYRITDPYLDPPDLSEEFYTEKSVRLPHTYWCYEAPIENLETTPPPSARTGFVTFGSQNNFCKATPLVLETWCKLLAAVPDSRLILHAREGNQRDRVLREFSEHGIQPERLRFVGLLSVPDYMNQYRQIDIALDPFPYGGGTTTCDALWMGVPVVTLRGQTAVGRGGVSILSNIGLPELIAQTTDEYIQIASNLAKNLARLIHLRSTLRSQMQGSSLMDAKRFAADFESAYRRIWQTWCSSQGLSMRSRPIA